MDRVGREELTQVQHQQMQRPSAPGIVSSPGRAECITGKLSEGYTAVRDP